MTTQSINITHGTTITTGDQGLFIDSEGANSDTVILLTTGFGTALVGSGAGLMNFIAAGPFDTLDSIGSSTPGYNAVFNDLGFHTHDVVDGLSRGSASLNNDGFQANNFVNGADFTVYGFNPGTSSVTQSGFALDFTNVNGSNFVVAFNGLSASQLASDLSHATTNPGAHQWTMPS